MFTMDRNLHADLSCSSPCYCHSKKKKKKKKHDTFPASTHAGIKGLCWGKNAAPSRNQAEVILERCNESEGSTKSREGSILRLGAPGEGRGGYPQEKSPGP